MATTMRERLRADLLFDSAIVAHHFAPYFRDYDLIIDTFAARPGGVGSYTAGRYRYRFTHSPLVRVDTAIPGAVWGRSWDDRLIGPDPFAGDDKVDGFHWGAGYADAYPGLVYVEESPLAREWAARFRRPMHEVRIETNVHTLGVIFHDVQIRKIAQGDPASAALLPIDPEGA